MSVVARLRRIPVVVVIAAVAIVAAVYLGAATRDAKHVERAERLVTDGSPDAALGQVAGITGRPAGARALSLRARALTDTGNIVGALDAYRRAAERAPDDWSVRRDWAVLLLSVGQRGGAQAQMNRALALNPRLELPPGFARR